MEISSTPETAAFQGGVYVSSNIFVVGIASATRYYGDGSALTGIVGSDGLGDHVATTTLLMSGFGIAGAGDITSAGKITAYSSVTVASGLGLGSPKLSLSPEVEISSTPETATIRGGVYVSSNIFVAGISSATRYYGDGSLLTGITASDNLGTHIMTANLRTGAFWISSDGGAEGLSVNSLGNVGVGVNPATVRLEVNDGDADTNTSGMKFTNFSCVSPAKLTVDVSGNLICATDQTGSGTGNLVDDLPQTLGAGNNAGGAGITNLGSLALGLGTAGTRLDVQADGVGYSQIWRDSGVTIMSSMSAAGVLYAEASGLRGLTLATTLTDGNSAGGIGITNLGGVAIGLGAAVAQLDVQSSGVNAQFWRNSGGTIVSSMTDTGELFAEASGLRGLTLATTLEDGNNAGGAGITNLGNLGVGRAAAADVRLDIQAGGSDEYMQVWRAPDGTAVSSMSAGGVLYAKASGLSELPSDGLGAHNATQDLNMGGFTVNNAPKLVLTANVNISSTPESFHGGIGVQVSSNVFIVGIASATKFYGDGSGLTNITGGSVTGMVNPATADLDMANNNVYGILSLAATNASITNVQAAVLNTTQPQLTISTHLYVGGHSAFGNGIAAASTFSAVSVYKSYTNPDLNIDNIGIHVRSEMTPPVDNLGMITSGGLFTGTIPDNHGFNSGMLRGVYGLAEARNNAALRYAAGVMGGVTKTNPGTLNEAFGGYFSVNMGNTAPSSNIVNAYGVYTMSYVADPDATITNLFGVYVDSPTYHPVPTLNNINNNYGVYINDQSGFGLLKSYNLYSAGAGKNYFNGNVTIGATTSAVPLEIKADSSNNAIRITSEAASVCTIQINNSATCSTAEQLIAAHGTKSLCLVCN